MTMTHISHRFPRAAARLPARIASGLGAGLLAASLLAAPLSAPAANSADAAAKARDVGLYYKVYVGGFHIADLHVDMGLAPRNYDVKADVKTTGMVGSMFPWWMKAYSRGVFDGGKVLPVAAGQQNSWRGKERFIDLKFAGGTPVVERMKPEPGPDDRDNVPEDLRSGALDLTGAIMAMVTRLDDGTRCEMQMPVFDGRRLYDLIAEPDGTDTLRSNRYSPYTGDTMNCRVWIDRKAGFKHHDESGWRDEKREARVWLGKAFGDVPPVPVRLTLETPFGALIAHLNRATYATGKVRHVLGEPPTVRAGVN